MVAIGSKQAAELKKGGSVKYLSYSSLTLILMMRL
jgi:hypothetical protein